MRSKRITAAVAAVVTALSLSGCSNVAERLLEAYESESNINSETSSQTTEAPDQTSGNPVPAPENGNDGQDYLSGATRLSMSGGGLGIERRTRSEESPMAESGWTILLYLCGTDLESDGAAAYTDLCEAVSAKYSDDVRLVIQTGGTYEWYADFSNTSMQRFVNIDGDIELVDEVRDGNMGDPDTLSEFVSWGVENYPAKHMGLVLWNHGGGSISGVCFDEKNNNDSLSLREIDRALNSVYDQMTDKFEFIGFDACLMSTLETANILVPYARYMFASEETEPGGGWNYCDIMNYLAENPDADGAELGKMQCESYYRHCIDNGDSVGTTFAITDLSKLDDLLVSFNRTAQEMYESGRLNDIARAVYSADNFGGNNRSEGYTNMVDLAGLLKAVEPYAPSASEALEDLSEAVIYNITGTQHSGAGGLSLYYPLAVQGSQELSIFSDICTSSYYLAFVDAAAYGTTGGDIAGYDNSDIIGDFADFWDYDYIADDDIGTNIGDFDIIGGDSTIRVDDIYFDDDGIYTVQLSDMDAFNYATCCLFMELEGASVFIGEDDEVIIDYDNMLLEDNFDGTWPSLDGMPLAIETVSVTYDLSVYTCPVLLNGKQTNLRIEYDWIAGEWRVVGAWAGIDPETGAAARETVTLRDGDVICPAYYVMADEYDDYIYGDEYTVNGDIKIEYSELYEGDYSYSMMLYDVYGNYYLTDSVTFTCDENGDLYFYPDELEYYY